MLLIMLGGLWVEQSQIRYVPWISHVFSGLCFFSLYAPPPMTSETMNGPSHCGVSLCTFSCISRRTRSPLLKVLVRRRLLWYVRSLSWYPFDLAMVVFLALF